MHVHGAGRNELLIWTFSDVKISWYISISRYFSADIAISKFWISNSPNRIPSVPLCAIIAWLTQVVCIIKYACSSKSMQYSQRGVQYCCSNTVFICNVCYDWKFRRSNTRFFVRSVMICWWTGEERSDWILAVDRFWREIIAERIAAAAMLEI
jgi:hypothetical protein